MAMLIIASVSSGYVMSWFPYIKFYIVLAAVLNIIGYGLFFTVNEHSTWAQQACYLMFCGKFFPYICVSFFLRKSRFCIWSVAAKYNGGRPKCGRT